MRSGRWAVLATLVSVAVVVPVSASASPAQQFVLTQARGEIKALGPAGIAVGHLKCSIPPSMTSVGRFVITDPVTIGCQGSILKTIRYAPPGSAETTSQVKVAPTQPAAQPQPSSPGPITSLSMSWQSLVLGGSNAPDPIAISATGTITSFDSSGVTIDGQTCGFPALFAGSAFQQSFLARVQVVGKTGTMTCTDSGSGGAFKTLASPAA